LRRVQIAFAFGCFNSNSCRLRIVCGTGSSSPIRVGQCLLHCRSSKAMIAFTR
jgi:hypothetical protein